jgi:hypothetical protein
MRTIVPKGILRCLKRYLAREIFKALTSVNATRHEVQMAA